jgi:hypothetical protein
MRENKVCHHGNISIGTLTSGRIQQPAPDASRVFSRARIAITSYVRSYTVGYSTGLRG